MSAAGEGAPGVLMEGERQRWERVFGRTGTLWPERCAGLKGEVRGG